jgi:phosphate starvation-inducible PhoH-like protein
LENVIEKNIAFDLMEHAINLFGNYDENIHYIEDNFNVSVILCGEQIKIKGTEDNVNKAEKVIKRLMEMAESGDLITKQSVAYLTRLASENELDKVDDFSSDFICLTARGKKIKSKTHGQRQYIDAIRNNDVVFSIGPAGTGKTFLAVAMAVTAFKNREVSRIILTRPAVEAGEKLGFLPGDLQNKVDPYLRPLYDSLHEIMGPETYHKHMEKGAIEVAPLAYMRGRTLDDSFIILDEAQNTTPEQMKMFLTRMGFGSKVVVTGDITQIDLPENKKSGLKEVMKILKNIKGIEFVYLTDRDVIRHELVQKIIKAYDRYDEKMRQVNQSGGEK